MATTPINPREIPITDDDGRLAERYLPDRLSAANIEAPVDPVLTFENALA